MVPATESTPYFSREYSSSPARGIVTIGSSSGRASKTPIASAFDAVTFELFKLGAIPFERFETEDYPEETVVPDKPIAAAAIEGHGGDGVGGVKTNFQAVAKIYEACMRTFGNSDPIKWEFMMELGPNCEFSLDRLAIRRNGSYKRIFFYFLLLELRARGARAGCDQASTRSRRDYGESRARMRLWVGRYLCQRDLPRVQLRDSHL